MTDTFMFSDDVVSEMESATELVAAPPSEYTIECTGVAVDENGASIRMNKNDEPYFMLQLEIIDADDWKDFTHYVGLPDPKRGKKNRNVMVRFRETLQAFGVTISQKFNPYDFVGKQADAILMVENDPVYGDKNRIEKMLMPK